MQAGPAFHPAAATKSAGTPDSVAVAAVIHIVFHHEPADPTGLEGLDQPLYDSIVSESDAECCCVLFLSHCCPACRPSFEQVVQQLEDMAGHLEELKQQQAHAMAAAAAPLFQPGHGGHPDSEVGHELTPSMMDELMPSGFGASTGAPADIEEEAQCSGVLYEMSQISSGSHDHAMHLELGSEYDADTVVTEAASPAEEPAGHAQAAGGAAAAAAPVLCAGVGSAGVGSVVGSHSHSSGNKHSGCMAAAS